MYLGRRGKQVYSLHTLGRRMYHYVCAQAEGKDAKEVGVRE